MKISIPENEMSKLTALQKSVLEFIVTKASSNYYYKRDGKLAISMYDIAKNCQTTPPTANETIEQLEALALLKVYRPDDGTKKGISYKYSLPFDKKAQTSEKDIAKIDNNNNYNELLIKYNILEAKCETQAKTISELTEIINQNGTDQSQKLANAIMMRDLNYDILNEMSIRFNELLKENEFLKKRNADLTSPKNKIVEEGEVVYSYC